MLFRKRLTTIIAGTISRNSYVKDVLLKRFQNNTAKAKQHPFDLIHGTTTSGYINSYLLSSKYSTSPDTKLYPYFGCQPNCLRLALNCVSNPDAFVFYDFGCGMGRALIIASEYNFKSIVGIEISPQLCEIADHNVRIIKSRYPDRPMISVLNADASQLSLGSDNIVGFLYNPFGPRILENVLKHFEEKVQEGKDVIIIYENPVFFEVIDASPFFKRRFGAQVTSDVNELEHHLDTDEAVAIWQSSALEYGIENCDFRINTIKTGWRVEIPTPR